MSDPIVGSLIKGVEYDVEKKVLTVRFKTSTYRYHGVQQELGDGLANEFENSVIESVFYSRVEGKYKSERVTA